MKRSRFTEKQTTYSGMEVSDSKRLKTLEMENAKLKKMPAEQIGWATLKRCSEKTSEAWLKEESHGRAIEERRYSQRRGFVPVLRRSPILLSVEVQM